MKWTTAAAAALFLTLPAFGQFQAPRPPQAPEISRAEFDALEKRIAALEAICKPATEVAKAGASCPCGDACPCALKAAAAAPLQRVTATDGTVLELHPDGYYRAAGAGASQSGVFHHGYPKDAGPIVSPPLTFQGNCAGGACASGSCPAPSTGRFGRGRGGVSPLDSLFLFR